ncbi:hypothetical protein BC940DRAFT_148597 [Gongronella butleri]|nr:hypothetical protein BC940DRAFT_148597 [Gongronella butleri]
MATVPIERATNQDVYFFFFCRRASIAVRNDVCQSTHMAIWTMESIECKSKKAFLLSSWRAIDENWYFLICCDARLGALTQSIWAAKAQHRCYQGTAPVCSAFCIFFFFGSFDGTVRNVFGTPRDDFCASRSVLLSTQIGYTAATTSRPKQSGPVHNHNFPKNSALERV